MTITPGEPQTSATVMHIVKSAVVTRFGEPMETSGEQLLEIVSSALKAYDALQNADGQTEDERKIIGVAIREVDALLNHLDSDFISAGPYGGLVEK